MAAPADPSGKPLVEEQQLAWIREGQLYRLRPGGEGAIKLNIKPGAFELTAASRLSAAAVRALTDAGFFRGRGIDWGCGSGVLALLAAGCPAVDSLVGLDLEPANVQAAQENAELNGSSSKLSFHLADSFEPLDGFKLSEPVDFIIANPPASGSDDGFSFRRRILREAPKYLKPGGHIFLQFISYYGPQRIVEAVGAVPGMQYLGLCMSTEWVPLKVNRQREAGAVAAGTLMTQLQDYADEEGRGGLRYHCHPRQPTTAPKEVDDAEVFDPPCIESRPEEDTYSAAETLKMLQDGQLLEPLCKWQFHMFQWVPDK